MSRRDRRSEPHVLHIGIGIEAVAGLVAKTREAVEVDADQLAVALHHLAGDQDSIDVLRAHAGDDRTYRIVHRHYVEPVGAQQDDVRILARRERADLALEAVGARLRWWRTRAPRAPSGTWAGSCRRRAAAPTPRSSAARTRCASAGRNRWARRFPHPR